jgi:hypothetical protein
MKIASVTRMVLVSLALFALFAAGCGRVRDAAARSKRTNDLKQIGLSYHNYLDLNAGKPPANADDLAKAAAGDPQAAQAAQLAKSGQYIILWGSTVVAMQKNPGGSSGTVLGYENGALLSGGLVLMGDGAVKNMTAAELQAAPKAQGK